LLDAEGLFTFKAYDSETSLKEAVQTRVLETGFIFSDDLSKKIENRDTRDFGRLIRSPATVTHGMAAEVVFAKLLHRASPQLIDEIVRDSGLFQGNEDSVVERIQELYQTYDDQGGTYQFGYEYLDGEEPLATGIPLFPIKGLTAIFIMLTAWIQVLDQYRDEAQGIYGAFAKKRKKLAMVLAIYIPVFIMTLAGFAFYLTQYPFPEAARELVYLMGYGLSLSLFLLGIKPFFKNPVAFAALMPAVLLGSLVASPVILDMSSFIKNLSLLEKFFFPSYYLALSEGKLWGGLGLLILALLGLILLILDPGIHGRKPEK
ncbi:MAG: hypothetical protein GX833_09745, partial [Clostridium sp.]|nr:hypothetical protein [Clostridium sp.]